MHCSSALRSAWTPTSAGRPPTRTSPHGQGGGGRYSCGREGGGGRYSCGRAPTSGASAPAPAPGGESTDPSDDWSGEGGAPPAAAARVQPSMRPKPPTATAPSLLHHWAYRKSLFIQMELCDAHASLRTRAQHGRVGDFMSCMSYMLRCLRVMRLTSRQQARLFTPYTTPGRRLAQVLHGRDKCSFFRKSV